MLNTPGDGLDPKSVQPTNEAVEQALASLVPQPLQVDREQLMFLAGLAAAHPEEDSILVAHTTDLRFWQTWAAVSSTLATGLALWLVLFSGSTWSPDPDTLVLKTREGATKQAATLNQPDSNLTHGGTPATTDFRYLRDRELVLTESWELLASREIAAISPLPDGSEHLLLNWRQLQSAELR